MQEIHVLEQAAPSHDHAGISAEQGERQLKYQRLKGVGLGIRP